MQKSSVLVLNFGMKIALCFTMLQKITRQRRMQHRGATGGLDGLDWMDWISPGGGMYRAPYGANKLFVN